MTFTNNTTSNSTATRFTAADERSQHRVTGPSYAEVRAAIAKRSFAILGSTSPANQPHAVGVVYAEVDGVLYISTDRTSRKARNVAANPNVFVNIAVRRMPFGAPPSSIQFQATAEILDPNHPHVRELVSKGRLKAITSHGELQLANGCIVRVTPARVIHTYGLGMSLRSLAKDPLNAFATVTAQ
jgi:nitroimidazol reductase NimA-like FMN-containing flavoprotein (pyridoxamine 5'-phosphate oxidase superfamily)